MILENSPIDEHMVLGDFNLHHPNWGDPNCRSDLLASDLVILAEQYHLAQLVPTGTITYSEDLRKSTIDLFFATPLIAENLLTCKIADDLDHHSDHMPIVTTISLATHKAQPMSRRNWQKTDKEKLRRFVQNEFSKIPLLSEKHMDNLGNEARQRKIDEQIVAMIQALVDAVEESTPMSNPFPYSRPEFTEECKEAQQRARQLKKRWEKNPTPETWEEFWAARNYKGTIIKKAMRAAYRKAVTEACTNKKAMWKFSKWSRNRVGQQQAAMPEIERETDLKQKALRFKEAFFTEPPASTGEDLTDYAYKDPYETPEEISTHEIRGAIYELSSGRAPGLDNIPSEILNYVTRIPCIQRLLQNRILPTPLQKISYRSVA